MNTENTIDASEANHTERPSETIPGISYDVIEEWIRANLEPLDVQISTRTHLLNQLIHDNSAKTTPMAGPRTHRPQAQLPLCREAAKNSNWRYRTLAQHLLNKKNCIFNYLSY